MKLSVVRLRVSAVALLVLTLALQGTSGLLAQPRADACPLQDDECCTTLRLTCCDAAPSPAPANVPATTLALRAPALTVAFLPPAVGSSTFAIRHAAIPAMPPWPSDDLPVFLHVLLI